MTHERPLNADEKTAHRELMLLVKADHHLAVERLLARRKRPERLLNATPTGCLLLDEAVSARMRGILISHGAKVPPRHEPVPTVRDVPTAFYSWATPGQTAL